MYQRQEPYGEVIPMKQKLDYKIKVLTEELIISKADIDYETNIEKREHTARLEKMILEAMR